VEAHAKGKRGTVTTGFHNHAGATEKWTTKKKHSKFAGTPKHKRPKKTGKHNNKPKTTGENTNGDPRAGKARGE